MELIIKLKKGVDVIDDIDDDNNNNDDVIPMCSHMHNIV